jgi:DNA-binding response OmpR family regulator
MKNTELNLKPVRILIADDDDLFLLITRKLMLEEGFDVITAKTGMDALNLIKSSAPDLAILDSNMPSLTGEEVCSRIKSDDRYNSIPVIILSGLEDEESKKRFIDSGCDDYFPKSNLIYDISSSLKKMVNKALKSL